MFTLPPYIDDVMKDFRRRGYQIFVVGGAVRDLILKKSVTNWDFATDASPNDILKLFPDDFYHNVYGTVSIPFRKESVVLEVTPFRKESKYDDFRHPSHIEWAQTIEEDLGRRDFTINAIAYDGEKIMDPFDGQKHIREKLIVAVGNPDTRFQEDALRLIRAVRFASELGFLINEKTKHSIQQNASLITRISWERLRDEFIKIIGSENPAEGILFLKNTGLLTYILPEVDMCFIVPQKSPYRHHIYDVGTHMVMSLKYCPSTDPITRLAALLHDVGKAKTFRKDEKTDLITFYNHEVVGTKLVEKIANRLKLSNKDKERLVILVKYHQFTVSETQSDKAVRRFIRQVGKENVQDMLDLRTGDRIGSGAKPTSWRLELFKKRIEQVQKEPFKITDLKINGNDVMEIKGIKPGPAIGTILRQIFDEVVEGKIPNRKETLLGRVKSINIL